MPQGPLGFVLFWIAALGVGAGLVLLVLGFGFGWLALIGAPVAASLLPGALRRRPQRGR